jgi:hypothetical protein
MSYDLYAVPVEPGEDPEAAWERVSRAEEEEGTARPPSAESELRKEELAAALLERFPELERFAFDYAEIARMYELSEDEARARYRHIELNTPEGANPIQLVLEDGYAYASVPYWHGDERAEATYRQLSEAFRIIGERTGWVVFDPQLERTLDLDRDLDDVLAAHGEGVAMVHRIAEDESRGPLGRLLARLRGRSR